MRTGGEVGMSQGVFYQLKEMIERDMAEHGLHADAVEMNAKTLEILERESEEISPLSQGVLLVWMQSAVIFVNNDLEDGKIHIGRRKDFLERAKYREIVEEMRKRIWE